jgi:methylaspartate ammonia-lyase
VPLYAQSGDERYTNVDKMITKKVDAFPHGLINTVDGKLGSDGRLPLDYVQWVRDRIVAIGEPGFAPVIHIDVFDALGMIFTTTSTASPPISTSCGSEPRRTPSAWSTRSTPATVRPRSRPT